MSLSCSTDLTTGHQGSVLDLALQFYDYNSVPSTYSNVILYTFGGLGGVTEGSGGATITASSASCIRGTLNYSEADVSATGNSQGSFVVPLCP